MLVIRIIVITVEVGIGLAVQVHTRFHLQGVLLEWCEVVLSDCGWQTSLCALKFYSSASVSTVENSPPHPRPGFALVFMTINNEVFFPSCPKSLEGV